MSTIKSNSCTAQMHFQMYIEYGEYLNQNTNFQKGKKNSLTDENWDWIKKYKNAGLNGRLVKCSIDLFKFYPLSWILILLILKFN